MEIGILYDMFTYYYYEPVYILALIHLYIFSTLLKHIMSSISSNKSTLLAVKSVSLNFPIPAK